MKVLLNIFESLLLSFAILLVVLCMTILNKRYVKFSLDRTNYYQTVVDKINHDIEYNHGDVQKKNSQRNTKTGISVKQGEEYRKDVAYGRQDSCKGIESH